MKRIPLFTYLKALCSYMYRYVWCYDASEVVILKKEPAVLGPIGLCKFTYTWRNRIYDVILNVNRVSFASFTVVLKDQKVQYLINRGRSSSVMDIDKWNSYIGPLVDFHRNIEGVYVPYCIRYFKSKDTLNEKFYTIYDTYGNTVAFDDNDYRYFDKWKNSCSSIHDLKKHNTKKEQDSTI